MVYKYDSDLSEVEFETRTDLIRLAFLSSLSHGDKNNTYKFAVARCLLARCKNSDSLHISYHDMASDFFDYYWGQLEYTINIGKLPDRREDVIWKDVKKELIHGNVNQTPKIFRYFVETFDKEYLFYELDDIKSEQQDLVEKCIKKIKNRLHNPIYRFEDEVQRYLQNSKHIMYYYKVNSPGKDGENKTIFLEQGIMINPLTVEFLRNNNEMLFDSVLLEWSKFLQSHNQGTPKIIEMLDNTIPEEREQNDFKKFFKIEKNCFYCNLSFEEKIGGKYPKTHVDHFLPHSIVGKRGLWNLVNSCKTCNCAKLDKRPPHEYVKKLQDRNEKPEYVKKIEETKQKYGEGRDVGKEYDILVRKNIPLWDGPKTIYKYENKVNS